MQKSPRGGRIVVILQARMGASRLPGKPLKTILGKPLLTYQIERLRRAKKIDTIIVATTTAPQDDAIVTWCREENVSVFRGSELDVLDRYHRAAIQFSATAIVRITGDCPLIDPVVVDQVIAFYEDSKPQYDYVSNSLQRTFPRGLDTEIFSFEILDRAAHEAKLPEEREHVTLYFYEHPEKFKLGSVVQQIDQSQHRWTVDTEEDFELVTKIVTELYPHNSEFTTADVMQLLKKHPEWTAINANVVQKPVR
ncbi:MAG: glycosyltransferase family protein [Parachlamydiaceae bacterium]